MGSSAAGAAISIYLRSTVIGLAVALAAGGAFAVWMFTGIGRVPLDGMFYCGGLAGVIIGVLHASGVGTRSIPDAPRDRVLAILGAPPAAGKTSVFLFRDALLGRSVGLNLSIDDQPVAQLAGPRFTRVVVPAGRRKIRAAFGGLAGVWTKAGVLHLDAPAAGTIVVYMTVSSDGFRNRIHMTADVDVEAAKAKFARMRMTPPDVEEL
jgi:hypothetical protein